MLFMTKMNKFIERLNKIPNFSTYFSVVVDKDPKWFNIKLNNSFKMSDSVLMCTKLGDVKTTFDAIRFSFMWNDETLNFEREFNMIKDWAKNTINFIEFYRTHLDELDVIQNFYLALQSSSYHVILTPGKLKSYMESCEKFYKNFKYKDEYRKYIISRFAVVGDGNIHYNKPDIWIETYYNWLPTYEKNIEEMKKDEECKDIIDEIKNFKSDDK